MTREDLFRVGLLINNVALSVDDKNLERVKPVLRDLEALILEIYTKSNKKE